MHNLMIEIPCFYLVIGIVTNELVLAMIVSVVPARISIRQSLAGSIPTE